VAVVYRRRESTPPVGLAVDARKQGWLTATVPSAAGSRLSS